VLLCGCVSTKQVRNQSLEVAKFDIAKFNGNYANKADTDCVGNLFYKLHPENIFHKNKKIPTDNATINFKFNGKKTLTVTTIDNNGIFKKTKLKGKIKNNYFSVRRKQLFIPIPMIFYIHQENKILLGNDKNGNLIVKDGFHNTILVLIVGGNSGISQSQYKKHK
jgi:hypothetical protein